MAHIGVIRMKAGKKKQLMSAACSSIQHKVNGSPDWINRKGFYVIETDLEKIRTAATN